MITKTDLKIYLLEIFDFISYVVFVGGIVFFIRFFIVNPFNVVGMSMYPTIDDRDFIIVDKITQRFNDYQRGDLIVFLPPGKTDPYVKRIVWLPGETIIIQNNTITLCQQDNPTECADLEEPYLAENTYTSATCGKETFDINDGFFVMGDNRWWSTDSRCCFGLQCFENTNYVVPTEYIIGKVALRVFPNFGRLE